MNVDRRDVVVFPPSASCPCDSGKVTGECCVRNGVLSPEAVKLVLPEAGPPNTNCFAAGMGGCSTKMSLEHYVSHSVLKLMSDEDGMVGIDGPSWTGRPPLVAASKFGAKTLCVAHNTALSDLDKVGHRFFAAFHSVPERFAQGAEDSMRLVHGHDLERWFLKMLCGFAAMHQDKEWRPPRHWVRALFGKREITGGSGLICAVGEGSKVRDQRRLVLSPMSDANSVLVGLRVELAGIEFGLLMDGSAEKRPGIYRPGTFRYRSTSTGQQQLIIAWWHKPYGGQHIKLNWSPDSITAAPP